MIVKAIICERMKCRGTLIWPAFLLIPVIPILLGAGNYLSNLDLLKSGWYSYWTQVTLFYATFFFAPLIGAYCAFLWRYENFNSCRNTLFACPVSYHTIYLSKFILVCAISGLTQIWFALLFFASGKVIGLPGLPPGDLCFWMIRGLAGAFVIAALQFLVATEIRSFATPIAVGWQAALQADCRQYEGRTPVAYSQMLLGMNSNKSEDVLGQNTVLFFVICAFYLLGVSLTGIGRIKNKKG